MRKIFSIRPGTLSLKTVLSLYFIPISVLPAILISMYATHLFEQTNYDSLAKRARSEKDAVLGEIANEETSFLSAAKGFAAKSDLAHLLKRADANALKSLLGNLKEPGEYRLYGVDGRFIAGRSFSSPLQEIPYLPVEALKKTKSQGETFERFFSEDASGFVTVVRMLVRDSREIYGIFEARRSYGQNELVEIKNHRGIDVMLLNRDLVPMSASFAVPKGFLKQLTPILAKRDPLHDNSVKVEVGDSRYQAFLYDLPFAGGHLKNWGYLGLFVSMAPVETTMAKLKVALIIITLLLGLTSMLLILIFSNRLVQPIERLVLAMKRVKTGRVEEIPTLDSTYEIEYLVRSFNEMSRNVSAAKRALEMKLAELRSANTEIKNTQTQLVQSAKMISLGQIVAGVAHELNNPIAFIYSNMHHLMDYISVIQKLIAEYRKLPLTADERQRLDELEKKLDVDFILRDMEDLTKSCVDGANRTKEIVLGLRTFSRMDEAEFRVADVHEGIRSTLKLLAPELKDKVVVHEEFGELPLVECNLSQLNQVFMNLISNAAQAMEAKKGEIWVRTRVEGSLVRIEIEDNGSGMSKEVMEKIFDPFFTTKKVGQGTGLGLSIAYGLIQKHQGTIQVESTKGKGTKFTIHIPVFQTISHPRRA